MLIECSGWGYNLALIFCLSAAFTKVLPYGRVSPSTDISTWLLEEKNQSNSSLLTEEMDKGSG